LPRKGDRKFLCDGRQARVRESQMWRPPGRCGLLAWEGEPMPNVEFLFLNRAEVEALAPPMAEVIDIVEAGLAAHGRRQKMERVQ